MCAAPKLTDPALNRRCWPAWLLGQAILLADYTLSTIPAGPSSPTFFVPKKASSPSLKQLLAGTLVVFGFTGQLLPISAPSNPPDHACDPCNSLQDDSSLAHARSRCLRQPARPPAGTHTSSD